MGTPSGPVGDTGWKSFRACRRHRMATPSGPVRDRMETPSFTLTSTGLKTPMHNIILRLARISMLNTNVLPDIQVRTRMYYDY
jgi:hypothetical protein